MTLTDYVSKAKQGILKFHRDEVGNGSQGEGTDDYGSPEPAGWGTWIGPICTIAVIAFLALTCGSTKNPQTQYIPPTQTIHKKKDYFLRERMKYEVEWQDFERKDGKIDGSWSDMLGLNTYSIKGTIDKGNLSLDACVEFLVLGTEDKYKVCWEMEGFKQMDYTIGQWVRLTILVADQIFI